jgi:hypothetical protein
LCFIFTPLYGAQADSDTVDMILPNHAVNFMFALTTVVGSAAIIIVADAVVRRGFLFELVRALCSWSYGYPYGQTAVWIPWRAGHFRRFSLRRRWLTLER